jgi:hypothetical protein
MSRQMLEPAQGEALPAEFRFPAKINGRTSRPRKPLREVSVEMVAADWLPGREQSACP